jgi:hypothetical protein
MFNAPVGLRKPGKSHALFCTILVHKDFEIFKDCGDKASVCNKSS